MSSYVAQTLTRCWRSTATCFAAPWSRPSRGCSSSGLVAPSWISSPVSGVVAGHNMDHLCLRVDPFDAEAIIIHLEAHGVVPGEVVERSGADGLGPSMYIHDPEGNMVELKGP